MSDPYAAVSVHGVMPLVLEPDGSLRFAVLGSDLPEDCLSSGRLLPDALVELFIFGDPTHLRIWADATAEVASNAVSLVLPDIPSPRFALLVRHDREPRGGSTLEEAIGLRNNWRSHYGQTVAEYGAGERRDETNRLRRLASETAYAQTWREEIAAIRATPKVELVDHRTHETPERLVFQVHGDDGWVGGGPMFTAVRAGSGYTVTWNCDEALDHQDLEEALVAFAAERNARRSPERGGFEMSLPALDGKAFLAVRETQRNVSGHAEELTKIRKGRTYVLASLVNERMMAIVKRAAAGFPVVAARNFHSFSQASATTGRGMEVPPNHVRSAVEAGYLVPVWRRSDPVTGTMVIVVTDLGRALLGDDPEAHALAAYEARRITRHFDDFECSDESLESVLKPVAQPQPRAVKGLSAELDAALRGLRSYGELSGWAVAAAALTHGLATVGADGLPAAKD